LATQTQARKSSDFLATLLFYDFDDIWIPFERIIQDIGEYCEHIFLSDEGGEDRIQSFEYLQSNFLPGGTIERACQLDKSRKIL
jgi:hypothetical protein